MNPQTTSKILKIVCCISSSRLYLQNIITESIFVILQPVLIYKQYSNKTGWSTISKFSYYQKSFLNKYRLILTLTIYIGTHH